MVEGKKASILIIGCVLVGLFIAALTSDGIHNLTHSASEETTEQVTVSSENTQVAEDTEDSENTDDSGIIFGGVKWGMNIPDFKKVTEYFTRSDADPKSLEAALIENLQATPWYLMDSGEYSVGFSLENCKDITIAGYECEIVMAYFAYTLSEEHEVLETEEQASLYAIKYSIEPEDSDFAYESLIEKLTSIYGEAVSDDKFEDEYGMYTCYQTIFRDGEETEISVVHSIPNEGWEETEKRTVWVTYSKIDGDSELEKIEECQKQKQVENEHENVDNTEGL